MKRGDCITIMIDEILPDGTVKGTPVKSRTPFAGVTPEESAQRRDLTGLRELKRASRSRRLLDLDADLD